MNHASILTNSSKILLILILLLLQKLVFNKLGDATDGVPNDSDSSSPPESPSKQEELKENNSSDFSPSKGSSSTEKVHMPFLLFLGGLRRKIKPMLRR